MSFHFPCSISFSFIFTLHLQIITQISPLTTSNNGTYFKHFNSIRLFYSCSSVFVKKFNSIYILKLTNILSVAFYNPYLYFSQTFISIAVYSPVFIWDHFPSEEHLKLFSLTLGLPWQSLLVFVTLKSLPSVTVIYEEHFHWEENLKLAVLFLQYFKDVILRLESHLSVLLLLLWKLCRPLAPSS